MKKIFLLLLVPATLLCFTHAAMSSVTFSIIDGSGTTTTGTETTGVQISIGGGTGMKIILPYTGTTVSSWVISSWGIASWVVIHSWATLSGGVFLYPLPPLIENPPSKVTTGSSSSPSYPSAPITHPAPHHTRPPVTTSGTVTNPSPPSLPVSSSNWFHVSTTSITYGQTHSVLHDPTDVRDLPTAIVETPISAEHTRTEKKKRKRSILGA